MEFKPRIHQKKNGTYQVSYVNPLEGSRHRKQFKTQKDAEYFRNKIIIRHSKGELKTKKKLFVGELLKEYLRRYPNSKLISRKNSFISFCNAFNHYEIHKVTHIRLREWFEVRRIEMDYSERTLCRIKDCLNAFFNYLMEEEILSGNPLLMVKFKNNVAPRRARVVLSVEEVQKLLHLLKEHSPTFLYPLIYAITQTGARRSEIMKLKWEDIDLSNNIISLRDTKNGSDRRVGMSMGLKELLTQQDRDHSHVFAESYLQKGSLDKKIRRFKKHHPFPKDWKCHDLRHSFAHNFLKLGRSMHHLKAILGHKSIQMTVDLYGSVEAEHIKDPSPFMF